MQLSQKALCFRQIEWYSYLIQNGKAAPQMEYEIPGIRCLTQEGGKALSWSEESGVGLME